MSSLSNWTFGSKPAARHSAVAHVRDRLPGGSITHGISAAWPILTSPASVSSVSLSAGTSCGKARRIASSHRSTRWTRSEEHTSELQSRFDLVCRLLLDKKKQQLRLGRPASL